jgi:hypothetical protein
MSGVVLNPWALVEEPRERAFRIGAALGCTTKDSKELVNFLRSVPVRQLTEIIDKAQTPEVSKDVIQFELELQFRTEVRV